jgi:hypothetical protein
MHSSPEVISNRVEHALQASSVLRREFALNNVIFEHKFTDYPFLSHEQAMSASEQPSTNQEA